ncbi:MAG: prepilin-type N-terminal cleavage/methylation domain-containing protein [Peptoniphilaceae bacterium]|nr:prepilin-type N-terminal cleavage/methylation domain-containing protein [Peptoniphilaceae bacterium]MDD7382832.1 prepilin-type N-terminal cleavage/methylation domain-containing protein [Peptoniphilaceae bacterium]MDY3738209.1 prepilin-type N-terminal cleavage/methylation domain-containing protein [Peptoniphilaceae bacterium]
MKNKGFTLIELLISLSIISIILAMVTLKFNIFDSFYEKEEINTLLNDLDYCKEMSIITGRDYDIFFKKDNYSINYNLNSKKKIIKKVNLNYIKLSERLSIISYRNRGTLSQKSDTYKIYGKKKKYNLKILPAIGFIKIEEV